jgi:hypothetical protein
MLSHYTDMVFFNYWIECLLMIDQILIHKKNPVVNIFHLEITAEGLRKIRLTLIN